MALAIDGFKVLRRISKNPELFPDIRSEAAKAAQAFVEKQLKAKATDVRTLQRICEGLGDENLSLIVEGIKDAALKTLANKLDKYHPEIKSSDANWRRRHIMALAKGNAAPTSKPAPVKRPRKSTSRKSSASETPRLSREVFDALKRRG